GGGGGGGGGGGRGGGGGAAGGGRRPRSPVGCGQRGRGDGPPMHTLRCADGASPSGGNRRTSPRIPPPLPAARPDQSAVARPHWKEPRATRRRQQRWGLFGGA